MVTATKRARADQTDDEATDDQVLDDQVPDDGATDDLVTALLTGSRVLVGVSARSLAEV